MTKNAHLEMESLINNLGFGKRPKVTNSELEELIVELGLEPMEKDLKSWGCFGFPNSKNFSLLRNFKDGTYSVTTYEWHTNINGKLSEVVELEHFERGY